MNRLRRARLSSMLVSAPPLVVVLKGQLQRAAQRAGVPEPNELGDPTVAFR